MTAIATCACGSPLTEQVEQWIGECSECGMPSALQVPLSPAMRLAVSGAATEALMRRRDRSYTPQELRNEQNADIEADLLRVPCEGCGDVYLMDDAPDGGFWCDLCTVSAVS